MQQRARKSRVVWLTAVCALGVAGCTASSRSTPAVVAEVEEANLPIENDPAAPSAALAALGSAAAADTVACGNLIKLSSYEDKNLNGKFRVDFEGNLELPYEVKVEAAGLPPEALKKRIAAAYSPYFKGAGAIAVSIAEADLFVDVEGLVQKPGQYLAKRDSTLDELIAKAGGLQQMPGSGGFAARYVAVEQGADKKMIRLSEYYAGARDVVPEWRGGDKLFFQSEGADAASETAAGRHYVQVLGEVKTPGEYTFENSDFFYYLSKAGGPTQNADLDNIEIIRLVGAEKKTIDFKMKDVRTIPEVQNGDIVMIHADKPKTFIQNVTSIIGSVATGVIAGAAL